MAEQADESDKCRIVTEAAIETAMDRCGSEEAVREQLKRLVGISSDEPDPDCEAALAEGLNDETLASTKGTRQWVMCRAWQLVKTDEMNLSSAVGQAWAEAKAEGEDAGVEV